MQRGKHAIFQVGNEVYGLDVSDVETVETYIKQKEIKKKPKNVEGVIDLRGQTIPVYSLRTKFNLNHKDADEHTRLLITKSNDILIAYEIDKILEIVEINDDNILETPPIIKSEGTYYIKQIANYKGRLIVLLDHNGILSKEEQEEINKVINKVSKTS